MKRVGEVTGVQGDMLEVTFCRPADCAKCHACFGGKPTTTLQLQGKANVGDAAVVDMPESMVLKASLLAYILPLVGLLGGAAVGSLIHAGDMGAAAGGVIGLAVTLGGVLLGEKKRRANHIWEPVLCEVWPKDSVPSELKEE